MKQDESLSPLLFSIFINEILTVLNCGVIAKYNVNKNFNFSVYNHLFDTCVISVYSHLFYTCVIPVILYGSEACGYNIFTQCDQIQYRAMRFLVCINIHPY